MGLVFAPNRSHFDKYMPTTKKTWKMAGHWMQGHLANGLDSPSATWQKVQVLGPIVANGASFSPKKPMYYLPPPLPPPLPVRVLADICQQEKLILSFRDELPVLLDDNEVDPSSINASSSQYHLLFPFRILKIDPSLRCLQGRWFRRRWE